MFLADYEATSTTLRWILTFLVQYPKYQEDTQRQMDQVIGDRRPSLANNRNNLPLVQAAILEALRVGNMVPLTVPHVALTDTTLQNQSIWIPNVEKTPPSLIRTAILTQKVSWSPTKVIFIQFALVNLQQNCLNCFCSCGG